MKILVVDDEKLIRDVIKEYLLKENFEVLEAENGEEAIDMCNKHAIDLMILDIMMPKMDGYTAYKTIKGQRRIPTIILSARSEEYDKLLGFDLGVDDFIAKPFSPKELVARVKAVTYSPTLLKIKTSQFQGRHFLIKYGDTTSLEMIEL